MAKVIEFYVSEFWPTRSNYIARKEGGKLIEFRSPKRNQANSQPPTGQQYMVYIAPFAANSASGRTHEHEKRWAIPTRNFGKIGRLIRPARSHRRLLRTRR